MRPGAPNSDSEAGPFFESEMDEEIYRLDGRDSRSVALHDLDRLGGGLVFSLANEMKK